MGESWNAFEMDDAVQSMQCWSFDGIFQLTGQINFQMLNSLLPIDCVSLLR
jgi:hypothetical protein